MTTSSWPITEQPVTHTLWADEFGGYDGLYDDYSGNGFRLVLPSTGDVATIKSTTSKYRLRGFVLKCTADHPVTLTAVATGNPPVSYDIGIKYDSTQEAAAGGPLSIYVAVSGSYSLNTSTTACHPMYTVVRTAGQVLSSATVTNTRIWTGAHLYGFTAGLPIYQASLGTRYVVGDIEYVRARLSNGDGTYSLVWTALNSPSWVNLPMASGLTTQGVQPSYARVGGEVVLRGGVQRSNGNQLSGGANDITIATLPSNCRPEVFYRFPVTTTQLGANQAGRLQVNTDGTVVFTPAEDGCTWFSLDGVRFFATANLSQ